MSWTWVVGEKAPSTVQDRELTQAVSKSVTWRVDGAAEAVFAIDGRLDETTAIDPLASDLFIYRDSSLLYRGRITTETDTLSTTSHSVAFQSIDYRGMLQTRNSGTTGASYTATDLGAIAMDLIDDSEARSGGNWGITSGVGGTAGLTRDHTVEAGKPLLEELENLGRLDNGFEWEISPTLALNRWYPTRGSATGVVIDYGGIVASAIRTLDPSEFANAVIVTGGTALAPAEEVSGTVGTDPRGRWEFAEASSSITEQVALDDRAAWLLAEASALRPSWSVKLNEDRWEGAGHIWLGDEITLNVQSGRLAESSLHRVVEVKVSLNANNVETVELGLVKA